MEAWKGASDWTGLQSRSPKNPRGKPAELLVGTVCFCFLGEGSRRQTVLERLWDVGFQYEGSGKTRKGLAQSCRTNFNEAHMPEDGGGAKYSNAKMLAWTPKPLFQLLEDL